MTLTDDGAMPSQKPLGEALAQIEGELAAPRVRPSWTKGSTSITEIPLGQVSKMTAVFQPRHRDSNIADDERHIDDLQKAIEVSQGSSLDPITVWWSGHRFYVVDGHHRLIAYQRHHGMKAKIMLPCVEITGGSLDEVRAYAGKMNHKNKLPMTTSDRINFAWRMTCTTELSIKATSECSGVAVRTVSLMRAKLRERLDQRGPEDGTEVHFRVGLGELTWKEVRRDNAPAPEWDDDKAHAAAGAMARRLGKSLGGDLAGKRIATFALALIKYSDRMPMRLLESPEWAEHVDWDGLKALLEDRVHLTAEADF